MKVEIKPIEAGDVEAFLDLCEELNDFDGTAIFDRDSTRTSAKLLLENPEWGRAVWLVANGERAGYLVLCFGWSFEFGGRTAVLEHLYVRESFRRQGIGNAAIQWAEELCIAASVRCVYLGVEISNQRAQSLYRQRGFENHNLLFWMKWLAL